MKDTYFNFFTEIEEYFVRKRGKNLLISPLDWGLIELWKENGIPLHVVLRGIDLSFEAAEKRRRSTPRTLFYCHPAVMEVYEQYCEATVGRREDEDVGSVEGNLGKEKILEYIAHLSAQIRLRPDRPHQKAGKRLEALADELRTQAAIRPEFVDRELNQIGAALVDELAETLTQTEVRKLEGEVKRELKVYRKRISPEMFEQLSRRQFERKLRDHFDLPDFSLFAIS